MIASQALRESRVSFAERKTTLATGSRLLTLGCLFVIFASQTAQAAHPFHTTFSEIEWNAETQRFEVALQLPGLQIDEELSRIHKRRVNTETTADAESLLQDYVISRFEITDKSHGRCRIHWVGMEVELRDVWVYFEVELIQETITTASAETDARASSEHSPPDRREPTRPSFDRLTITNRILTDVLTGQLNMANIIVGHQRASLNLTAEQPSGVVPIEQPNNQRPKDGKVHDG